MKALVLSVYYILAPLGAFLGDIVASPRRPTPLDAGSWGQPLKNKVLAESSCGFKAFCMEDSKSEPKGAK